MNRYQFSIRLWQLVALALRHVKVSLVIQTMREVADELEATDVNEVDPD